MNSMLRKWLKDLPLLERSESISKKIFQTYPNKDLPKSIETNIAHLKELHPDWNYELFDDASIESYIQKNAPSLYPIYSRINPLYGAAKADFFRYLIIYLEGGLYLDIKSSLSVSLNEQSLESSLYLSHWNRADPVSNTGMFAELELADGEYQQWFILAPKGHPLLREVIESLVMNLLNYNPFKVGTGKLCVLRTTGPIAFTKAIYPLRNKFPVKLIDSQKDLSLNYSIYEEKAFDAHTKIFRKHYSKVSGILFFHRNPIKVLVAFSYIIGKKIQAFIKT